MADNADFYHVTQEPEVEVASEATARQLIMQKHEKARLLAPNGLCLGKITGNEQEDNKKAPNRDRIVTRLVMDDQDPEVFHSQFKIEFTIHYTENGKHLRSVCSVFFNDKNLVAPVEALRVTNLPPDAQQMIANTFRFNPQDPEWQAVMDQLYLIMVPFDNNEVSARQGFNLFTKQTFGSMNKDIKAFREFVRGRGLINMLTVANPNIVNDIASCNQHILAAVDKDPDRKWFPSRPNYPTESIHVNYGEALEPELRPKLALKPQMTFKHPALYFAILAYASRQNHEFESDQLGHIFNVQGSLLHVNVDKNDKYRYLLLAYWPASEDSQYRPRTGDRLKVAFNGDDEENHFWSGRVAAPLPYAPRDRVCIYLTRPRNPDDDNGYLFPETSIEPDILIGDLDQDTTKASKQLAALPLRDVAITARASDSEVKRQWRAINELTTARAKGDEYSELILRTLCATNFEDLPLRDLWGRYFGEKSSSLLSQFKNSLNADQYKAVCDLRQINGPIHILTGPPGTGKSTLLAEITVRMMQKTPVLIAGPINDVISDLAVRLQLTFKDFKAEESNAEWIKPGIQLILRCHANQTERQIVMRNAVHLPPRPAPFKSDDINQLEDIHVAKHIYLHHNAAFDTHYVGIGDKRVTVLEMSVGHAMAVMTGIIVREDGTPAPWAKPDHNVCVEFLRYYRRYERGDAFNSDENQSFTEAFNGLRQLVLSRAAVVCTTLSNATQDRIHANFKPGLVIVDEATKAMEPDCWGIFAFYASAHSFILTGDPQQLRPVVKSARQNPLAPQLRISMATRLLIAGASASRLTIQMRSSPEITQIFSKRFYNNTIQPAPLSNYMKERIQKAKALNRQIFNIESTVVVLDAKGTSSDSDEGNPSLYNIREAVVAVKALRQILLAKDRFATRDIALMAPYVAQVALLKAGVIELGRAMNKDLSHVLVCTLDEMTGLERDCTILSPTFTRRLGFMADGHRLNVAISRARFSLIIVCNKEKYRKIDTFQGSKIDHVFYDLRHNTVEVPQEQSDIPPYLQLVYASEHLAPSTEVTQSGEEVQQIQDPVPVEQAQVAQPALPPATSTEPPATSTEPPATSTDNVDPLAQFTASMASLTQNMAPSASTQPLATGTPPPAASNPTVNPSTQLTATIPGAPVLDPAKVLAGKSAWPAARRSALNQMPKEKAWDAQNTSNGAWSSDPQTWEVQKDAPPTNVPEPVHSTTPTGTSVHNQFVAAPINKTPASDHPVAAASTTEDNLKQRLERAEALIEQLLAAKSHPIAQSEVAQTNVFQQAFQERRNRVERPKIAQPKVSDPTTHAELIAKATQPIAAGKPDAIVLSYQEALAPHMLPEHTKSSGEVPPSVLPTPPPLFTMQPFADPSIFKQIAQPTAKLPTAAKFEHIVPVTEHTEHTKPVEPTGSTEPAAQPTVDTQPSLVPECTSSAATSESDGEFAKDLLEQAPGNFDDSIQLVKEGADSDEDKPFRKSKKVNDNAPQKLRTHIFDGNRQESSASAPVQKPEVPTSAQDTEAPSQEFATLAHEQDPPIEAWVVSDGPAQEPTTSAQEQDHPIEAWVVSEAPAQDLEGNVW